MLESRSSYLGVVTIPHTWSELTRTTCRAVVASPSDIEAVRVSWNFESEGEATAVAAAELASRIAEEYGLRASATWHGLFLTVRISREDSGRTSPSQPGNRTAEPGAVLARVEPQRSTTMPDVAFLTLAIAAFAAVVGIAEFLWRV